MRKRIANFWGKAAGAAVAVVLACLWHASSAQAEPVVVHLSGRAEIRADAEAAWERLQEEQTLAPGSVVRTRWFSSVVIEDREQKSQITLDSGSELHYRGETPVSGRPVRPAANKAVPTYVLEKGEAEIEVVPGHNFDLLTPLLVTSVRGTKYTVSVKSDGSSSVLVSEGNVFVLDYQGVIRELQAGESYTLSAAPGGRPVPVPELGDGSGNEERGAAPDQGAQAGDRPAVSGDDDDDDDLDADDSDDDDDDD